MLKKEFQYYLDHQADLVKKYNGKYLVIVDSEVKGAYETQLEAYTEGEKKFDVGKFLIQRCSPGNADYSQTFHSRVSF